MVTTLQAFSPALHANHDGCVQEQVTHILQPLWVAAPPPLLSAMFKASMHLLCTDLVATHHATSEARELAQHANQEVHEDCHDAPQIFEG